MQAAAQRYASARVLLRRAVAEVLDLDPSALPLTRRCPFCGSAEHGPPALEGSGLRISVAHCDGLVGVALSAEAVGLDLEKVRPLAVAGVLGRVAAPRELEWISGLGHRDAIRVWAAKEAVGKMTGRGVLDARGFDTGALFGRDIGGPAAGWVREVDAPAGYVATLATPALGRVPSVPVRRADDPGLTA